MEERIKNWENNIATLSLEFVGLKELIAASLMKVDNNFTIIAGKLSLLEKKVGELNYKVDKINYRLENLDGSTTRGFGEVGDKLEGLAGEIQKISVVTRYDEMYRNQKGLEN